MEREQASAERDNVKFLPFEYGVGWGAEAQKKLTSLASGKETSGVSTGRDLAAVVVELRTNLGLNDLQHNTTRFLAVFFDHIVPRDYAAEFFERILPGMAALALKLPELVRKQTEEAARWHESDGRRPLPLQVLTRQQPGLILLSQETVASLLACSFFCVLPEPIAPLPRTNNFNFIFLNVRSNSLYEGKLHCLVNYFRRVTRDMPTGYVSYERKVLAVPADFQRKVFPGGASGSSSPPPTRDFSLKYWRTASSPLCNFEVRDGSIEEEGIGYLQVDFANRFLGGGALRMGAVQEEIRFMLNPEMVCGMFFMEEMSENESIEIIGSEQFSAYTGYMKTFRFAGDFVDETPRDKAGRRRTKIIAMDAMRCGRYTEKQFESNHLLSLCRCLHSDCVRLQSC